MRKILMMLVAIVAIAIPASAEVKFGVGPTVVQSNGLGFESPYGGAILQLLVNDDNWIGRVEASVLDSQKLDAESGTGLASTAMVYRNVIGGMYLGVGIQYSRVETDYYEKGARLFAGEALFDYGRVRMSLGYARGDSQIGRSVFMRIEDSGHGRHGWSIFGDKPTYNQKVAYQGSLHTAKFSGRKLQAAYIFRF